MYLISIARHTNVVYAHHVVCVLGGTQVIGRFSDHKISTWRCARLERIIAKVSFEILELAESRTIRCVPLVVGVISVHSPALEATVMTKKKW